MLCILHILSVLLFLFLCRVTACICMLFSLIFQPSLYIYIYIYIYVYINTYIYVYLFLFIYVDSRDRWPKGGLKARVKARVWQHPWNRSQHFSAQACRKRTIPTQNSKNGSVLDESTLIFLHRRHENKLSSQARWF